MQWQLIRKHSDLRNESQDESRNRVGESLSEDFINFMIKDAEKTRPEQKPSETKAKKKEKPQEGILSRLDYFESPENDTPLKFAPCINGVLQVKISCN